MTRRPSPGRGVRPMRFASGSRLEDEPDRAVTRQPRRWLARLFSPELCLIAAILLALVCLSISGQAGLDGSNPRDVLGLHGSPVEGLAFAPDGRTAASASRDGTARVWQLGAIG